MADTFKTQSTEDLLRTVAEKREALRVFRFGGAGSRVRNVRDGRNLRREIAQMLTEVQARRGSNKNKKRSDYIFLNPAPLTSNYLLHMNYKTDTIRQFSDKYYVKGAGCKVF